MEQIKNNKKKAISSCYETTIQYSPVTINLNGQIIEIVGRETLQNLNLALIAMQAEGRTTTRMRDRFNNAHTVNEADIKSIIAQGAIWGNAQWNKKVDLHDRIDAITIATAGSEAAAISQINAITW